MWYRAVQASVSNAIDQKIKHALRTSPFFKKLFESYGVDLKDSWRLRFQVADLQGELAKTKGDLVIFDPKVFENGLDSGMHFVVHEITHWLTRQKEQQNYFADPEELRGFDWAIAHEMSKGRDINEIEQTFLPLITPHFSNDGEARAFFVKRLADARRLVSTKGQ